METAIVAGIFAVVGVFVGQRWSEMRERRNRRDELKLELYLEVVPLIIEDQKTIVETDMPRSMPSLEHQGKQHSIRHRLMLLAPDSVLMAYNDYHSEVFKQTTQPDSTNRHFVTEARERLIKAMRPDIDGRRLGRKEPFVIKMN
jgi:hypothetical protein